VRIAFRRDIHRELIIGPLSAEHEAPTAEYSRKDADMDMPASTARNQPSETGSPASLSQVALAAWMRPEQRLVLVGTAGCLGMLALAFLPTLRHFAYVWSTDENYSHGFLVPLISLYFANEAARRGPVRVRKGVGLGVALLVISILGRLATIIVPVGIVGDGAFLLGLAGLCCLLFGTEALRRYWFALFFLVFMIPLPVALYAKIASPLQLMVSQVASVFLNAIGIPVLREGNLMTLPGGLRMFVAEACSGIRQLTGFLALTTAVAYLTPRPLWYRGVVVASSIPIALTANVVRVMVTGLVMYYVDPQYASGTFHTFEGLIMMGLGLAMLGAECWLLNAVSGSRPARAERFPVGLVERQSTLQGA
jgi:exosortase